MSEALVLPNPATIADLDAFLVGQNDDGMWELVDGQILAMTNPSLGHEEIVGNIDAALRSVMPADRRCRVAVGGVRLQVSDNVRGLCAPRPDVMVWCGPMRAERSFVTTPMIVVEVLSPSTMDSDRGAKLRFYKTGFQTLRQIVLVYQDQMRVETYHRTDLGWEAMTLIRPAATLEFPALVFGMTLADIYAGVELPAPLSTSRILVIRLGALGDFVLSFAAFAAIRAHHPGADITLLTTAPFADLARAAPWFDHVTLDARPDWWNPLGLLALRRRLRGFDLVYDLQTSARSSRYFRLAGRPPWSGIAPGGSLPHANPDRDRLHTLERQRDQLAMAGITAFPPPELGWLVGAIAPPPAPYALLVPGAAPHRPAKRWPAERFAELATLLRARGLTPVVVGTGAEAPLAVTILAACPSAVDLTGRTTLFDIAGLARAAALAIGNDTGPMHLAACVGCPCVALFSAESDPALTAPRGPGGTWPVLLRAANLADLPVARVAAALP